jgi:DNA repair protein RecN (Recombination protein N)
VVQARRDLIFTLTRKYGPTLEDVIETGRRSREELDLVDGAELDLRSLSGREQRARELLGESAAKLSKLRRAAARRLAGEVDAVLPDLGMPDGHLEVAFEELGEPSATGAENVHFRITLNRGHEPRALARVASGGELSRVMLALKTILARLDRVPTLVFDEVDAGIGGTVGLRVGETMRRVAEHHQVFAITHLAQIAARAHQHIVVSKGAPGGVTTADVRTVEDERRVEEIARMLGGDPESEASRIHARELLAAAGDVPNETASAGSRQRRSAAPRRR